jgi:putative aminopeptidase FrvX
MAAPSKESQRFLEAMLETRSPSGFEAPVQNVIREYMQTYADEWERDVHGNQWFVVNPKAPLRVVLMGHVDECGYMVNFIDEKGFIWVTRIGGMDPLYAWGSRVFVHAKEGLVPGVIGKKPIHNTPPTDREKGPKLEDLFVDIGAKDKETAEKRVRVGDPITPQESHLRLGEDLLCARGMDDRIGAFVVMEALRKIRQATSGMKAKKLNCAVYAVGSVQEEVGLRGARTASYRIDPHVGIAVDVGFATDYPGEEKKKVGDFKLGAGPSLHRGPNFNTPLFEFMEDVATKQKIPVQLAADGSIPGTDAGMIQVNRNGCATALVSIPNRYMHSPVEMVSLSDVEHASELLAQTCLALKAKQSFIPE